MAGDNDETHPDPLSPGATAAPRSASDASATTAVGTPSPPAPATGGPQLSHLEVPPTEKKPPPRRPLPSEAATALASQPHPEARRRSNATRSTRHILLHFSGSAPRNVSPDEQRRRDDWEARRRKALAALERLRDPPTRSRISHFWRVKTHSETLRLHHEPSDYDARRACEFWFPKPADFPIHVCDFTEEGGSRRTTTLANIEDCKKRLV